MHQVNGYEKEINSREEQKNKIRARYNLVEFDLNQVDIVQFGQIE